MSVGGGDLSEFSMMDLFRMEVETQVSKLNQGLIDIEQENSSADVLESLMRAAHSIKGAARMVNVEPVVQIAHEIEDCFVALQNQQISLDQKSVDTLLDGVKLISQVGQLKDDEISTWDESHQNEIEDSIDALKKVHGGSGRARKVKTSIETVDHSYVEEDKDQSQTAEPVGSLTIRIPVDRLDRILDLAGKSLIQSHELNAAMPDLWQVKHQQQVIISQINRLQEHLSENNANDSLKDRVKSILEESNKLRHQYADGIAKLDTIDRRSSTISDYLHKEIMASRMRPISEIFNGLPLLVRDFSHRLKKEVRLQMSGLYTLVDRHVLERIDTPIKHLVQNAIDHGIELPKERKSLGKEPHATLSLNVSMNAGMLSIALQDDGRGVDFEKIKEIVKKKGLASSAEIERFDESDLLDYLFYPGFSTQDSVSEISGRGVGLDLVKDAVIGLNGSVHAYSTEKKGMRFQIYVPLTISVIRVLMTTICGEYYAFPTSAIGDVHQIDFDDVMKVENKYYTKIDDQTIVLVHSNEIFNGNLPKSIPDHLSVILISNSENTYGVVVDKTYGEQELSIHNLSPELGKIRGISSAAILNNGALTLIIDIEDYIRSIESMIRRKHIFRLYRDEVLDMCEVLNVLVVDDSMTVREMQRKILKEKHFQVSVSEDGVHALNAMQQEHFDILVTDVDMPNMDGLRLINEVRYLSEYADIPILVISNREKSFVKQHVILDEKTVYYPKDQFSPQDFLNSIQLMSKLVVNIDVV